MRPLRAESEAGDGGILVSCKALRMGMGASYCLARLARICRLHFASCRWCLPVSAKRSARCISNLCGGPVCCAHQRVLAQRRTATVALGCRLTPSCRRSVRGEAPREVASARRHASRISYHLPWRPSSCCAAEERDELTPPPASSYDSHFCVQQLWRVHRSLWLISGNFVEFSRRLL